MVRCQALDFWGNFKKIKMLLPTLNSLYLYFAFLFKNKHSKFRIKRTPSHKQDAEKKGNLKIDLRYHNNPTYWDRQAYVNSIDPDLMPQNTASDQGLHCLPLIQQALATMTGSKMDVQIFGKEKEGVKGVPIFRVNAIIGLTGTKTRHS